MRSGHISLMPTKENVCTDQRFLLEPLMVFKDDVHVDGFL